MNTNFEKVEYVRELSAAGKAALEVQNTLEYFIL
jgi:hypothetical protein